MVREEGHRMCVGLGKEGDNKTGGRDGRNRIIRNKGIGKGTKIKDGNRGKKATSNSDIGVNHI